MSFWYWQGNETCSCTQATLDAAALVTGPCLMALAHLARRGDLVRSQIADANGILVVINCMRIVQHPTVLVQACRTLSTLSLLPQNRQQIANSKGISILVRLLASSQLSPIPGDCCLSAEFNGLRVNESIQESALAAFTNLTNSSEPNRQLVAELGGIEHIVSCVLFARHGGPVRNAAQAIANISYGSYFSVARCMMARADVAICSAISATDFLDEDRLLEAAYRALANMALDEAAQTGLASGDAMVWCVRGLQKCGYVHVLRAAACATAAIAYKSRANKAQFAQLGALAACVRVVSEFGCGSLAHTQHYLSAVHATSLAACTLLSFSPNHLVFEDCYGIEMYTTLCETTEHLEILSVGAMVLASVAPTASGRWEAQAEGRTLHFEKTAGLSALVRCAKWVFFGSSSPHWLQQAIFALQMSPIELDEAHAAHRCTPGKLNSHNLELFPQEYLFEEVLALTTLDHIVTNSPDLRDLVFRLY